MDTLEGPLLLTDPYFWSKVRVDDRAIDGIIELGNDAIPSKDRLLPFDAATLLYYLIFSQ